MRSPLVDRDGPWFRSLDGRWRFSLARASRTPFPTASPMPSSTTATGPRSTCPGAGRCRGSTGRSTRTCRCRSAAFPPDVPDDNPTGLLPHEVHGARRRGRAADRAARRRGRQRAPRVGERPRGRASSKDSRLEAAFDVTEHVHRGENVLALMVVRWSDASYVEDQDQWWHAGIDRERVPHRTPTHVCIDDVHATRRLGVDRGDRHARRAGRRSASPKAAADGWIVAVAARDDAAAGACRAAEFRGAVPTDRRAYVFRGHVVDVCTPTISRSTRGRPRSPNRYRLVVTLLDDDGACARSPRCTVGFRSIEIRDRELLVNGAPGADPRRQPPRLRSRHRAGRDRRADAGRPRADEAVRLQRGAHVARTERSRVLRPLRRARALRRRRDRTSRATRSSSRCATTRGTPTRWLDRGSRMVTRDKNHPSIILWSLGNESGLRRRARGARRRGSAATTRSRPLHYEGAIMWDWGRAQTATDVLCPMYPEIADIVEWAEQRRAASCR